MRGTLASRCGNSPRQKTTRTVTLALLAVETLTFLVARTSITLRCLIHCRPRPPSQPKPSAKIQTFSHMAKFIFFTRKDGAGRKLPTEHIECRVPACYQADALGGAGAPFRRFRLIAPRTPCRFSPIGDFVQIPPPRAPPLFTAQERKKRGRRGCLQFAGNQPVASEPKWAVWRWISQKLPMLFSVLTVSVLKRIWGVCMPFCPPRGSISGLLTPEWREMGVRKVRKVHFFSLGSTLYLNILHILT